jgi:heme-degrading monooxygenase HmoA
MTTLKRHHAPDMPPEVYDQANASVAESELDADGFVAHYGFVEDDGGITVIEIWESKAQHDKWFEPTVRPLLPPNTPEPEFWEIRSSRTK